jgi:hypothetical protein
VQLKVVSVNRHQTAQRVLENNSKPTNNANLTTTGRTMRTTKMRVLQSILLLAAILLVVAFQLTVHQAHFSDKSSSLSAWSSTIIDHMDDHHHTPPLHVPPPTCQFHNIHNRSINRIYFLHMRKAGGSSLRSYFAQVAEQHGVQFQAAEGPLHPEPPGQDEHTLYITHVREPLARAISHYKFERRWDCQTQLQQHKQPHHKADDYFVPTVHNIAMSLYNFTMANHSMTTKHWTCASNCQARWAAGRPAYIDHHHQHDDDDLRQQQRQEALQELEQAARASLWNYNIILVSEWIQQDSMLLVDDAGVGRSYVQSLESIFGVGRLNRTRGMTCGKRAAAANQLVPLVVQPMEWQLLQRVNSVDLRLYHELTACQPTFLIPPQHDDDNDDDRQTSRVVIQWNGTTATSNAAKQQRGRDKPEG